MDFPVSSRDVSRRKFAGHKPDQDRLFGIGEAGQHVQTKLPPRTQPELHARHEIYRFPLKHVRRRLRLRGGNSQSRSVTLIFEYTAEKASVRPGARSPSQILGHTVITM